MKKTYINPTVKTVNISTRVIMQGSPNPDSFSLSPSGEQEYEGYAD
ncbi:MAG: hypothetical protein MJY66_07820 [Bacteroidaceae bacterium]|nr:hypothetical protein [Bacteroidaceae bacterium]